MSRKRLNFTSNVRADGSKFERRLSFLKSPPDKDDKRYLPCVSKGAKLRVDGSKFERRLVFLKSPPDTDDARYLACVSKEAKLHVEGSCRWFEVREKAVFPEVTS